MNKGLKDKEVKQFIEIMIKANWQQLEAMITGIEAEMGKRDSQNQFDDASLRLRGKE